MQIYRNLEEFKAIRRPILTLGTYDGVHLGHQKILARLQDIAFQTKGEMALLTFHPHPRKVLFPENNDLQLLNTLEEKINLLRQFGVKHLLIHPFTKEFSQMDHGTFVREILVEKIGVHTLVIGYDHQFGHDRKGSFKELQQMAPRFGFVVEEIPEQDIDEVAISSTRIRKLLKEGNVMEASYLLGYQYSVSGTVIKGKQLGRTLGYPTANLDLEDSDKLIPANGIYAVMVKCKEKIYKGVLSIGNRPTFDNGPRSIEVNIFDFNEDIYGEWLTIKFIHHLREEIKFESKEALITQMDKDKMLSMELLNKINV